LNSVPLNVNRSSAFVDYIAPYLELQSTLAYLKKPPTGYNFPGVDVFGGLAQIKKNLAGSYYKSQFAFEADIWSLVNILPHDFHFNLHVPLMSIFAFRTFQPLVSVSTDGLKTPSVYFKGDLDKLAVATSKTTINWTPSPIVKINGQNATDYLLYLSERTSAFQDPDANYNQMFYSLPFAAQGGGNLYDSGAHIFGFTADKYDYTFANGTTISLPNYIGTSMDWSEIASGADLFSVVDMPNAETTNSKHKRDLEIPAEMEPNHKKKVRDISAQYGYPTPVVAHSEGYTSGFFLSNSSTAVLVMTAFASSNESSETQGLEQQYVIQEFLTLCKKNNKTKLILDVSANGGGIIYNGYDAFKQLFPTLVPYGASRLRTNPAVDFIGELASNSGIYNSSFNSVYQTQSNLDVNLQQFPSWSAMNGPNTIYGDNFTAELRYNFSDPVQFQGVGFNVSGYLSRKNIQAQVFAAKDIVLLYDGSCGSTCTIFSELLKAQAGVRSIAVGGRPQNWPMQGVAGSKGSQVYTFGNVAGIAEALTPIIQIFRAKNKTLPAFPSPEYIPSGLPSPLGQTNRLLAGSRYNLRNAFHQGDKTNTPLQFIYEASNCKLFYKPEDIYSVIPLWRRADSVAWGSATCVPGSTVNANNSFPLGSYDTVPHNSRVVSSVKLPAQPGLILTTPNSTTTYSATATATATGPAKVTGTNGAESLKVGSVGVLGAVLAGLMMI
jgi:hypothetical protein